MSENNPQHFYQRIQHWISMLTANMAIIGALATIVWQGYAKPIVETVADDRIEQWKHDSLHDIVAKEIHSNGGFRSAIANELGKKGYQVDKSDIPVLFVDAYVWTDSLKSFDRFIKPMLKKELRQFDVGLKVDRLTDDVEYLHTDGRTYFPSFDPDTQKWYILINGAIIWCQ